MAPHLYGSYGPRPRRRRGIRGVTTATLMGALVVGGALTGGMWVTNTLMGSAVSMSQNTQVMQVAETLRMASLTTQTPLYSNVSGPQVEMVSNTPPASVTVPAADKVAPSTASQFTLAGKTFDLPVGTTVTVVDHDTIMVGTENGTVETQFDTDSVGGWFEDSSTTAAQ